MKSFLILLSFLFLTAIATSFVFASPVDEISNGVQNEEKAHRSRRDLAGIFDSISNGFEGLVKGARKVSDSVFAAFNSIFSSDNQNHLSAGFEAFGKGLRDAFNGVKDGFSNMGDKIKGAWNGKGGGSDSKSHPEGEVPGEETT